MATFAKHKQKPSSPGADLLQAPGKLHKSRLLGGAFCFLSACSGIPAGHGPVRLLHQMDANAWTQDADPDDTLVVMNYEVGTRVCGRTLTAAAAAALSANEDAVFGDACGGRVVLVRSSSTPRHQSDWAAIAAHEAFHSAVQYTVLRPRFDSVSFPGYPSLADLPLISSLSVDLATAIQAGNSEGVCTTIDNLMKSSDSVRDYFLYRSYWEWPAEHYMRHSAMKRSSYEEYLGRRASWGGGRGNPLYEVGVLALDQVEARLGRTEWQREYLSGEAPINMLAKANACAPPLPRSFQVDALATDIFEAAGDG